MNKKLKWFCVQPLTGGAYLGAEEAIGYKADGVISFQDFAGFSKDKEGNVIAAANEQILVEYLKQKNRLPDWYMLNHAPFVADTNFNPGFIRPEGMDFVTKNDAPDYSNTDLVVAVPFCSGLSMSSTANDEHKAMRNCNMVWIANYVIRTIQPKIYLFENAPTLMSVRGTEMRMAFEKLASETGYSVVYYKTDTKLHHNCQRRPRTFIMLIKNRNGKAFIPEFRYEQDTISIDDFFKEMTENLTQENDPMDVCYPANDVNLTIPLAYIKHVFGSNWREHDECHGDIIAWVCVDKAKQIDMLKKDIGIDAGTIWRHLSEKGILSIREIGELTNYRDGLILMALGWLATHGENDDSRRGSGNRQNDDALSGWPSLRGERIQSPRLLPVGGGLAKFGT